MVRGVATTTIAPLLARHLGESAQVFRGFANLKKKEVMLKRRNRVISLSMPKFAKSCAQNASVICVVSLPVIHCI